MQQPNRCLEVRRGDLRVARITSEFLPEPSDGQALLRIDRFGLSSNNITYGATGDALRYWEFFPAGDGWGRLPAWGFADVVAGSAPDLAPGHRVFGYLPMAEYLLVEPTQVGRQGFTDGAAHRSELAAVYNRYRRVDADPLYQPQHEALQTVFFPLFVTSWMLEDFLADNRYFGAEQVVISSASSKTAIGTALCAERRAGDRPALVGLTSPGHVDFVESLGCYDDVVAYPDVDALAVRPTVFVDVAGDMVLRLAVHRRFADDLRYSCAVGLSHWDAPRPDEPLPGPSATFFFAPTQVAKRHADWGRSGYDERLAAAWRGLIDTAAQWFTFVEVRGLQKAAEALDALAAGTAAPAEAFVVDLNR